MKKRTFNKVLVAGLTLAVLFVLTPTMLHSADSAKGNIIGYIYAEDGTSPLQDAVVNAYNLATGKAYLSTSSDSNGFFKLVGVERGIYNYSVKTTTGEFAADGYLAVRVRDNETAKMAIAVKPYEKRVAEAKKAIEAATNENGEALIGRVVAFDSASGMANVFIINGMLSGGERIHALGEEVDFYQNVDLPGEVFAGDTAGIKMKKSVNSGDLVYLAQNRGFPFMIPLGAAVGAAALVGGSYAVTQANKDEVRILQETGRSPIK